MSKLLKSSPIHTHRLRRLALALLALGLLILAGVFAFDGWQNAQAARAREDYHQRIFFNPHPDVQPPPPFLTAGSTEIVYAPGQTVLALAEGFQPHEALFVRLYSRMHGLLDAFQTRADVRGQFIVARPLSLDKDTEMYTPPGGLWFQVEALSGRQQVFHFRLEKGRTLDAAEAKGIYPPVAVPGSVVAFWCGGFQPDETLAVKAAVDGREFRPGRIAIETYPVASDGLLLGTLVVSLDDPTGEWHIFANHCQLDFSVRSTLNTLTVGQGVPHVDHTP